MHEYDLIADWYARDRTHLTGLPGVQSLALSLPPGASVLDVACGNGIALTKFLVDAGFDVVGIDSSPKMLEKFRVNLPGTPAICSPIQTADLPLNHFDAAISWGMLFHLPREEQSLAIAKVASVLKNGGQLLFTSGDAGADGDEGLEGSTDERCALSLLVLDPRRLPKPPWATRVRAPRCPPGCGTEHLLPRQKE